MRVLARSGPPGRRVAGQPCRREPGDADHPESGGDDAFRHPATAPMALRSGTPTMAEPAMAAVTHPSARRPPVPEGGAGDRERRSEHGRVAQAPREGGGQQDRIRCGETKKDEAGRRPDQPHDDHAPVAVAVGKRTGSEAERGAEEQHGGDDLAQQRHADPQVGRHGGEEGRRRHEGEHPNERGQAQRRECPARVGRGGDPAGDGAFGITGASASTAPLPVGPETRFHARAAAALRSPSGGDPGQNLDRAVAALNDQALAVPSHDRARGR